MDIITAYQELGSFRAAAECCGTTPKTVKRVVTRHQAGQVGRAGATRVNNYEPVRELVETRVEATKGRITAKRLLPAARAAGYEGSARNFRRLVSEVKTAYRAQHGRGRRPAVWTPGEHLVIDWGVEAGLHVFCAVLAFSRYRFVRFAADERAETTLALLAECFEDLGGVPQVVLADRMGCLKGGVVADVVVPAPDYLRFAAHYRFRPDFCQAHDPQSKGIVENLVGYAKTDLMIGLGVVDGVSAGRHPDGTPVDLIEVNRWAKLWCLEVNLAEHSEICAIPNDRLRAERDLLGALPSLRPSIGRREQRKVDALGCVRWASARYSVPGRYRGTSVEVLAADGVLTVLVPDTGEVVAVHELLAPGGVSLVEEHYDQPRPDKPARKLRARSDAEKTFLALGAGAEAWLRGAAAAGNTRLGPELTEINTLTAGHGQDAIRAALHRATVFGRWHARDIASILAAGSGVADPTRAGDALVIELPTTQSRALADYSLDALTGDTREELEEQR